MAYVGYVTTLKNVRKHPNADRLQLAECFGNTVCVSLEYIEGQVVVYFPTDGQLSEEFAKANNLLRLRDENGHTIPGGGYMDPDKRNITAIRLRGEKSDGLALPLSCLATFGDISTLKVGDTIDTFNGHLICQKYIPKTNHRTYTGNKANRTRKKFAPTAPLFVEHADTEQLAYNLSAFKPGDEIEITLKMHGTSQRTAHLPVLKGYKRSLLDKVLRREGTPVYDWGYVSGTRRVVLDNYDGGFYGSNEFREPHSKIFEGKLWKGETAYYEVVGFMTNGQPIMENGDNKKLNDKEFVKQYGETTVFSYGCSPFGIKELPMADTGLPFGAVVDCPQSDIYVYRMTMTNEDGNVVEYTPGFMRYRCEQMGVKTVPVFWKGIIPYTEDDLDSAIPGARVVMNDGENAGEWIKKIAEQYYDGPDPIGKTHIREGVVVRIVNRPKFSAFKIKNFSFKCIEGLVKADAQAPDIEEAQEVKEE